MVSVKIRSIETPCGCLGKLRRILKVEESVFHNLKIYLVNTTKELWLRILWDNNQFSELKLMREHTKEHTSVLHQLLMNSFLENLVIKVKVSIIPDSDKQWANSKPLNKKKKEESETSSLVCKVSEPVDSTVLQIFSKEWLPTQLKWEENTIS